MVTIPMDAHQCKNVKLTDVFFSGPPKSPKSHVQDQLMNGICEDRKKKKISLYMTNLNVPDPLLYYYSGIYTDQP